MKKSEIALSAATIASAISAISQISESGNTLDLNSDYDKFADIVSNAIASSQSQRDIRMSMPLISNSIKIENELLSQKYYQVSEQTSNNSAGTTKPEWFPPFNFSDKRDETSPLLADSTIDSEDGDNYQRRGFGCYTNCHSACHGSRGWR